jgi:hypothetical protein
MLEIPKMDNFEDRIENEAYDFASEAIFNHYGVSEISELTEEQVDVILQFIEENDGAIICMGLQCCVNEWEEENS